jgi:hypothetical protein
LNENRNILIFCDNLRLSIGRGDRRNYRADGLVLSQKNIKYFAILEPFINKAKEYCENIIFYLLFSCKVIAFLKMNEDLKRERSRTSFDTKELSAILYGGAETHSAFKRLGMYRVQYLMVILWC